MGAQIDCYEFLENSFVLFKNTLIFQKLLRDVGAYTSYITAESDLCNIANLSRPRLGTQNSSNDSYVKDEQVNNAKSSNDSDRPMLRKQSSTIRVKTDLPTAVGAITAVSPVNLLKVRDPDIEVDTSGKILNIKGMGSVSPSFRGKHSSPNKFSSLILSTLKLRRDLQ